MPSARQGRLPRTQPPPPPSASAWRRDPGKRGGCLATAIPDIVVSLCGEHCPSLFWRPPILHTSKTILVVDDDASARKLVVRLLADAGFAVIDVPSPQRALDIAESGEREVALLLSDVRMPKMDGVELARRFTALRPGVGILLMSGFHDHGTVVHRLLQKPFTGDELVSAVESLLG